MKKPIEFYVIGNTNERRFYGGTPTLIGAKRLAGEHAELISTFDGLRLPSIYRAEDTETVDNYYGLDIRRPKRDAIPVWSDEPKEPKERKDSGIEIKNDWQQYFRDFLRKHKYTQRAFSETYHVPLRTVEEWSRGSSKPYDWAIPMFQFYFDNNC